MNPFLLPPDERLANWKEFRKSLIPMEDHHKLKHVANYWAQAPLMSMAYDLTDACNWPTPWEMIYSNEWCRSSIAIGMEATLRLAGIAADRLSLRLILDRSIQIMLLILVVDGTLALNYEWGIVTPYPATAQIIHQWNFAGRSYFNIS